MFKPSELRIVALAHNLGSGWRYLCLDAAEFFITLQRYLRKHDSIIVLDWRGSWKAMFIMGFKTGEE